MAGTGGSYHDEDPGSGAISDINVTPLVDITLVLLIIFMVTAKLIASRGISVESPKTVSGSDVASQVEVTIRPGLEVYLNGERLTDLDALTPWFKQATARDPELKPIITADKAVPHGEVMEVIDRVKRGDVKRFALTTVEKRED